MKCATVYDHDHYFCPSCENDKFEIIKEDHDLVNFKESTLIPLKNITDFKGIVGRQKYVLSVLGISIIYLILLSFFEYFQQIETNSYVVELFAVISLIFLIYGIIAIFSLGTKRCKDLEVQWYYQFIPLYFLFMIFKIGNNKPQGILEKKLIYIILSFISIIFSCYLFFVLFEDFSFKLERMDDVLNLFFLVYFASVAVVFLYVSLYLKTYEYNNVKILILELLVKRKNLITKLKELENESI